MEIERTECKICGEPNGSNTYRAREMMFGYRDEFTYFECSRCGCLQIAEMPADLSKYYPSEYYSFGMVNDRPRRRVRRLATKLQCRYAIYNKGLVGRAMWRMFPSDPALMSLRKYKVGERSKILDVGAGAGHLLYQLWAAGFRNLLGIDAFIERDIAYRDGLTVLKRPIHQVGGEWDVIMFHHSFEHIANPIETLQHCAEILASDGCCLIRIPTTSSYAWRTYRENWVQLDAPRHFFLLSLRSMEILAAKVGLELAEVVYDSTEFQFWGSEQYVRDIPLKSARSYSNNPSNSIFSSSEIRHFREKATLLNAQNDGDQAAFYLRKILAA